MNESKQKWSASRKIHLPGGCRAFNGLNPTVALIPKTLDGTTPQFTLATYAAIYSEIEGLGFSVLGAEFYSRQEELDGLVLPNWRVYHRNENATWSCNDTLTTWAQISNGAYKRQQGRLWDLARRLCQQFRVCEWRVRQISEAYADQLKAEISGREFQPDKMYDNGFVWLSYLSIQSFLDDACILRDRLAEFAAHFIFGPQNKIETVNVASMAGLLKLLKRRSDGDALGSQFLKIAGDGGWLKELGAYRDLVVHASSLGRSGQKLLARTELHTIGKRWQIPGVTCPIPENPDDIARARASGAHLADFNAQLELSSRYLGANFPVEMDWFMPMKCLADQLIYPRYLANFLLFGPKWSDSIKGP